jgi:hypothetical protein
MQKERFSELSGIIEAVLSRQLFFICGAPKSGTTWLQRLLDAHPQIMCAGEGHFTDKIAQPLAQLFDEYNRHYQLVTERVYQGRPYYRPLGKESYIYLIVAIACLTMAQRGLNNHTRCVGDKTPRYCLFLDMLREIFPRAKFLHIIRDGRDTAVSVLHHANRAGIKDVLVQGSEPYYKQISMAALAWKQNVRIATQFGEKQPEITFDTRYEALLNDTESELKRILSFLTVDDSVDTVRACIEEASFKKWSGREQGDEAKDSFFRKGIAGDWPNYFDDKALGLFQKETGDLLEKLGYEG